MTPVRSLKNLASRQTVGLVVRLHDEPGLRRLSTVLDLDVERLARGRLLVEDLGLLLEVLLSLRRARNEAGRILLAADPFLQ